MAKVAIANDSRWNAPGSLLAPVFSFEQASTWRFIADWLAAVA